jgi:hypothetical protein
VIATTDPVTLPDLSTFYLIATLPVPGSSRAQESEFAAASVEEAVRLYGLRMWVEERYKQVKHALGWSEYQVRSDQAIRRHWQLVCCAFSFCWYHQAHVPATEPQAASVQPASVALQDPEEPTGEQRAEEKRSPKRQNDHRCPGPKPCEQSEPGSNPGSCSNGSGSRGRHIPHLSRSSSFLSIFGAAPLSICMQPIDPSQQSCASGTLLGEEFS